MPEGPVPSRTLTHVGACVRQEMWPRMRSFPSDRLRPNDRRTDREPLSTAGLLVRVAVFLLVVLGLEMAAQLLSAAPR